MASSTYFKPDVEVLQQFQNLTPLVNLATLQSVIVGPAYKRIKDFNDAKSTSLSIGAYSKSEIELPFPALGPGADVIEGSLGVTIKNYAGEHIISKSEIRTQGNSGSFLVDEGPITFIDFNQNFNALGVVASTELGDHDGDFLHILYGAAAGYYEIQSIVDNNTLIIDDPDGVLASIGSLSPIEYVVGSFGWMRVENGIKLTPRLSDSGTVYLSGMARRKDYVDRVVAVNSIEEMEEIFGAGEVSLDNPLAYGMAKALPSLGANEVILGLMVEDDTTESYQKAFEMLETEEVYCIVPLTTNPIVHQVLKEHVVTMSSVTQKKERIGLFNTSRQTRVTKSGYLGRQNKTTGVWDMATGNISASGVAPSDVVQMIKEILPADGSGVAQVESIPSGYDRLVVYFRPNTDFSFSYSTVGAPSTDVDVTSSFDSDGVFRLILPAGQTFNNVKFTSSVAKSDNCHIHYMTTAELHPSAEIFYPSLIAGGTQMDNPYLTPTPGHRALKIRSFFDGVDDPLIGTLPGGMKLRVSYGVGQYMDVTSAGTHVFSGDILNVYVTNGVVSNADNFLVEVMALANAGTYKLDRFTDENATFLSDKIVAGEDELVLIDKSAVDPVNGGYKEVRYLIGEVVSETELRVSSVWNDVAEDFVLGSFPGLTDNNYYRVQTPVITNKYVMARWYRDISAGFAERRMTHIFAPAVGVATDGVTITPVPGYYFACAYAGATQSDAPQRGFTNRSFAGFVKVFFTNDYFTEAQMNIIAEGGTTIVVQPNQRAPLTVRHQLTTNMDTVETREYSVTKNVDHMAKTARLSFRPYIGRYLINSETMNLLYKVGAALIERWISKGQALPGSVVDRFQVDPNQIDRVYACFKLKVPIPLNFIRLIFVI